MKDKNMKKRFIFKTKTSKYKPAQTVTIIETPDKNQPFIYKVKAIRKQHRCTTKHLYLERRVLCNVLYDNDFSNTLQLCRDEAQRTILFMNIDHFIDSMIINKGYNITFQREMKLNGIFKWKSTTAPKWRRIMLEFNK